jgi:hypothetical protein
MSSSGSTVGFLGLALGVDLEISLSTCFTSLGFCTYVTLRICDLSLPLAESDDDLDGHLLLLEDEPEELDPELLLELPESSLLLSSTTALRLEGRGL